MCLLPCDQVGGNGFDGAFSQYYIERGIDDQLFKYIFTDRLFLAGGGFVSYVLAMYAAIVTVFEMMLEGKIDPDLDRYHEVIKILSKELGIDYVRKEKHK